MTSFSRSLSRCRPWSRSHTCELHPAELLAPGVKSGIANALLFADFGGGLALLRLRQNDDYLLKGNKSELIWSAQSAVVFANRVGIRFADHRFAGPQRNCGKEYRTGFPAMIS